MQRGIVIRLESRAHNITVTIFLVPENIFALFPFLQAHSPIPALCLLPLSVDPTDSVLSLQCPSLGHLCVSGLETASGSPLSCPRAVDFALLVLKEGIVPSLPSFSLFCSCTHSSWLPVRMTGECLLDVARGRTAAGRGSLAFVAFGRLLSLLDYLFCTHHFVTCLPVKNELCGSVIAVLALIFLVWISILLGRPAQSSQLTGCVGVSVGFVRGYLNNRPRKVYVLQ